jgi:hypothetical protein
MRQLLVVLLGLFCRTCALRMKCLAKGRRHAVAMQQRQQLASHGWLLLLFFLFWRCAHAC